MRIHKFIKLFSIFVVLMFVISVGHIFTISYNTGLISLQSISSAENMPHTSNFLMFAFFFLLIAFSLVYFFTWASNKNVIEEDDYLTKNDEFELYRPHR